MGRKYMCRRNKSTYVPRIQAPISYLAQSHLFPNKSLGSDPALCAVETRELLGLRLQELEKAGGAA